MSLPENDKGIENHIPFVNRLVAWWARMKEKGWHDDATPEQRAAVLDKQMTSRKALNAKLAVLVAKRDRYVAEQQAKSAPKTSSFDRAVADTLRAQIAR